LSNVAELPLPPNNPSVADIEDIWQKLREHGPIVIEPLSPHGYILALVSNNSLPSGAKVAWFVARNYNTNNLKNKRMLWWHISGAALTIWLTRHWSQEQLFAEVRKIFQLRQSVSSP
jgi:hypothetical protein